MKTFGVWKIIDLANISYPHPLKSRVQQSFYKFAGEKSKGFLIAQSISGEAGAYKFSGSLALFDTDDYENRQYLYEKNVLWAFSIPNF